MAAKAPKRVIEDEITIEPKSGALFDIRGYDGTNPQRVKTDVNGYLLVKTE